jgi:hypothetical protein
MPKQISCQCRQGSYIARPLARERGRCTATPAELPASCPTRKCLLHKDLLLSKHGAAHAVFRHPTLNLRLTNSPSGTVWIFLDDSQTPARIAAAMLMSMQQLVSSAVSVDPPVLRTCSPIFALSAKNLLDRTTTAWKATWRCRPHGLGLSAVLQLRSCSFGPAPSVLRLRSCAFEVESLRAEVKFTLSLLRSAAGPAAKQAEPEPRSRRKLFGLLWRLLRADRASSPR